MLNRIITFCILLFTTISFAHAGEVTLKAHNINYAGLNIQLYYQPTPYINAPVVLGILHFSEEGDCNLNFSISKSIYCQANFDSYTASIYLVPGHSYQLIMPERKPLKDFQKRNPFFQATQIAFGIATRDSTELNQKIERFNLYFNELENKYFDAIYTQKSQDAVTNFKTQLKNHFPKSEDNYFELFKYYKTASIDYALYPTNRSYFFKTYLNQSSFSFLIPSCAQLFKKIVTNYFYQLTYDIDGEIWKQLVNTSDLNGIRHFLVTKKSIPESLCTPFILNGIEETYYQNKFSKRALLKLAEKLKDTTTGNEQKAAITLYSQLIYLQKGTKAPTITLIDLSGKTHSITDFRGKEVYLHFTRVENPICRQHLDFLKTLPDSILSQIHLVIAIPENEKRLKESILKQNWPGTFYTISDSELKKYNVKNFPSSLWLTPDGKIDLNPAKNPIDGIKPELLKILHRKN